MFDISDLTWGEEEDLEEYTGMTIAEIGTALRSGNPSLKVVSALIWIGGRRNDPTYTIAQARAVNFKDLIVPAANPVAEG